MRKKTAVTGMLALALSLVATTAGAAPTVTITTPADGSTVSKSASPTLTVTGDVAFDTPEASELQFFVRRTGCTDDKRLSVEQGAETSGCAEANSHTPANEITRTPTLFNAADGLPFTLDASRSVQGVVTLTSFQQPVYAGGGQVIVDISLSGSSGGTAIDLGSTSVNYIAIPSQPPVSTPWTISPPTSADKKDFTSFTLSLTIRGIHITHGYVRPNGTNLTLPTYSASFTRAVQTAVDNASFTSTGVTVSPDFTSYSANLNTPAIGAHTIKVRAVQGGSTSAVVTSAITVTA